MPCQVDKAITLRNKTRVPRELADPNWRHPYDDEDDSPSCEIEVARKMMAIMSAIIDEMPDCPEKYGVAYAIGSNSLAGRSMSEIAAKLGTTRALISYRAVEFCKRHKLPPSPYMRSNR
jgi:hypothetical protein